MIIQKLGGFCKETARFLINTLEKAGRQDIQSLKMQSPIKFSFLNTFGHKLFGQILKYIWTTTVDRHLYWKVKENIFNKQNPTKKKNDLWENLNNLRNKTWKHWERRTQFCFKKEYSEEERVFEN